MSVITSAEYITGVDANLLDEGIDRYFGIGLKSRDSLSETGIVVKFQTGVDNLRAGGASSRHGPPAG